MPRLSSGVATQQEPDTKFRVFVPLNMQMTPPIEPWFKSFVWSEVLVQLPFFFVGAYAFATRKNWIRIPAIIYGSFVCATMVPILTVLATHRAAGYKPGALIAFYMPYLVVPALLVMVMAGTPQPFSPRQTKSKKT